jgi:hypothetical protein
MGFNAVECPQHFLDEVVTKRRPVQRIPIAGIGDILSKLGPDSESQPHGL